MGELTDMVYYDGITLRGYFVNDPTVIKNRSSSLYEVTIDFEGDRL